MRFIPCHSWSRYSLQVAEVGLYNPSGLSECDICKSIPRRQQVIRQVGTCLLLWKDNRHRFPSMAAVGLSRPSMPEPYLLRQDNFGRLPSSYHLPFSSNHPQAKPRSPYYTPILSISSYPRLIPCNFKKREGVQTDIISVVAFPL
jgi:hypothetical protein